MCDVPGFVLCAGEEDGVTMFSECRDQQLEALGYSGPHVYFELSSFLGISNGQKR